MRQRRSSFSDSRLSDVRLLTDESAGPGVEYAMGLALVAAIAGFGMLVLGGSIKDQYTDVGTAATGLAAVFDGLFPDDDDGGGETAGGGLPDSGGGTPGSGDGDGQIGDSGGSSGGGDDTTDSGGDQVATSDPLDTGGGPSGLGGGTTTTGTGGGSSGSSSVGSWL